MQSLALLNQHIISEITYRLGIWDTYTSKRLHGQLPNVNPKIHSQRSYVHQNFELMCRRIPIRQHIQMQIKHFHEMSQRIPAAQNLIKMKSAHTHAYAVALAFYFCFYSYGGTYTQFMIEKSTEKTLFCTRLVADTPIF